MHAPATPRSRLLAAALAAVATLALSSAATAQTSPAGNGTAANVFILDAEGNAAATMHLGPGGALSTDTRGIGAAVEAFISGTWVALTGTTPASSQVFVNAARRAWPTPVAPGPQIAIVGLTTGSHTNTAAGKPGGTLQPRSGTYTSTIAVRVTALPALAGMGDTALALTIDGTPVATAGLTHTAYLMDNGPHTVAATITETNLSGTLLTTTLTRTYTLAVVEPATRDTDGDGIPDRVEIEAGTNPLEADLRGDRDGDGWSDGDEVLRGTDPDDPGATPLDTDGDGWSDWDEAVRGTLVGDPSSHPVARTLWEPEVLVDGETWIDGATTATWGTVRALDLHGALLADKAGLIDTWGTWRLPAGLPIVLWARSDAAGVPDARWSATGWIPPEPHVTAGDSWDLVEFALTPWSTAAEWRDAAADALAEVLVVPLETAVSPDTTPAVAALELAVGYAADAPLGETVRLGDPEGPDVAAAAEALLDRRDGAALLWALAAETAGGALDDIGVLAALSYLDLDGLSQPHATRTLAELLQTDPLYAEVRYLVRLWTYVGPEALAALSEPEASAILLATGDADGDGIGNGDELGERLRTATDPLSADTDGDGLLDGADLCPRTPGDACLLAADELRDSDGDGVVDVLDNCLHTPNPLQTDADGDGLGSACGAPAFITEPRTHRTIAVGAALDFAGVASATGAAPVTFEWRAGATGSVVLGTGPTLLGQVFATPGSKVLRLFASEAGGPFAQVDHRDIEVVAP